MTSPEDLGMTPGLLAHIENIARAQHRIEEITRAQQRILDSAQPTLSLLDSIHPVLSIINRQRAAMARSSSPTA